MRTRTLLLLAVGCGLLILVAGSIQLLRIATQDETELLGIGDTGSAGEAVVEVRDYDRESVDGFDLVEVTLSGVDDPQGLDSFTLRAPGEKFAVSNDVTGCVAFTAAPTECTLAFATGDISAGDRQLVLERGGDKVVWDLVP
ncbi:MAG TPA: hypothetical protein VL916_17605 [Ilumatobacteraceae bacterium]|nr:hypothetical protein [Ilumatobacteraceae bacterium]